MLTASFSTCHTCGHKLNTGSYCSKYVKSCFVSLSALLLDTGSDAEPYIQTNSRNHQDILEQKISQ